MDQHHGSARPARRRAIALALACVVGAAFLWPVPRAGAAIVATVPLGTAASYSVLGASTVTNTNATVLHRSLGLWPGTDVTGFPPGLVVAPGTTDVGNAVAQQAQSDLTAAYVDAAGRPVDATTTADLTDLVLPGGVYSGPSKGALLLTGTLVLDGGGDPSSVFIFQTGSSLTTATGSTVRLVGGAQECNVFWQVGSSATLGTGSVFVGNILALASVTVDAGVTVHGRALARTGAVTMDGDVFTAPTCATGSTPVTTPTSITTPSTTPTTTGGTDGGPGGGSDGGDEGTATTAPAVGAGGATTDGTPGAAQPEGSQAAVSAASAATAATVRDPSTLPRSGGPVDAYALAALALVGMGLIALGQRELASG